MTWKYDPHHWPFDGRPQGLFSQRASNVVFFVFFLLFLLLVWTSYWTNSQVTVTGELRCSDAHDMASVMIADIMPTKNLNIKMSYQYRNCHYGDKMILRPSYLHNSISFTGKMTSLYWIRALVIQEIWASADKLHVFTHPTHEIPDKHQQD